MQGDLGDDEARKLAENLFLESLPRDNVGALEVDVLANENSRRRFQESLKKRGNAWSKVRVTWHLPGSAQAASSIRENGISCDEDNCSCGRYGLGGYVALSAAKANAYA